MRLNAASSSVSTSSPSSAYAGAGLTDNGDELPGMDREADAVENFELVRLPDVIGFHNVPHVNDGAIHGRSHSVSSSVKSLPSETKYGAVSPSLTMSGNETTRSPMLRSSLATPV